MALTQMELMQRFYQNLNRLVEMGLGNFARQADAIVDTMIDLSGSAARGFIEDPETQLPLFVEALDQVIARGDAEIAGVMTDFVSDALAEVTEIAPGMGFTLDQVAGITNRAIAAAAANNYQIIRQIIPPIRNDIINVFTQAMREGIGISEISERLRLIGLPWSPTGKFSPGERAMMQANAEFSRITESIQDDVRIQAGLDMCFNQLNTSLNTHSDQCIAATAAGLIDVKDMEQQYGKPPRHPNCGCALFYAEPDWMEDSDIQGQLDRIRNQGTDVDAAVARWDETGADRLSASAKWQENLDWENNVMSKLFGG